MADVWRVEQIGCDLAEVMWNWRLFGPTSLQASAFNRTRLTMLTEHSTQRGHSTKRGLYLNQGCLVLKHRWGGKMGFPRCTYCWYWNLSFCLCCACQTIHQWQKQHYRKCKSEWCKKRVATLPLTSIERKECGSQVVMELQIVSNTSSSTIERHSFFVFLKYLLQ